MVKKFALALTLVLMASTAHVAEAATQKPRDEACQYVQRSTNLFDWLKNAKNKRNHKTGCANRDGAGRTAKSGNSAPAVQASEASTPGDSAGSTPSQASTSTDSEGGKGNNGKGTPNGSKTDGGDPPGGGNTGNDGQG